VGYYNEKGEYVLSEDPGWIKRATRPRKPEPAKKGYWEERKELEQILNKSKKEKK
jgi:hypothetical protein